MANEEPLSLYSLSPAQETLRVAMQGQITK